MKNHAENVHQKLVADSFLILLSNPKQSLHAILKIRYFERGLSKNLKKVNFIFPLNPVPFHGQSYQKKGLELVTSCSSSYKTSSEKFLY